MNAPDRFELFLIPEGQDKVKMDKDTKIPNAASFLILKEDHTLANILRIQLLQNPKVLFAGYKVAHPLEHQFILKVQTTPDTTPLEVLKLEIDNLIAKYSDIRRKVRRIYLKIRDRGFENEFTLHGIHGN